MTAGYNRYHGNSGFVERVPDAAPQDAQETANDARSRAAPQRPVPGPAPGERRPPSPLPGLSGELGRLLKRLSPAELETEDFLVIAILYLLYRESGDAEFLFAIGGYLLL